MSYSAGCKDWTQTIAIGGSLEAADTNEFQTNIDWIKDNLACLTHDTLYRGTHYSGDDVGHNSTYQATHYTTYQATNDSLEKASHNSTYKTTNYIGNLSSHYDQNYSNHDLGYDATYNVTHNTSVYPADAPSEISPGTNCSLYYATYDTNDLSSVRTTHNATYKATNQVSDDVVYNAEDYLKV